MTDLATIANAKTRTEYDAALDALLQNIAAEQEAAGIPEGAEIDAAEAMFQRAGYDGVPTPPAA